MTIMGIDASSTATGWSIFEDNELIAHGTVKPKGENWREKIQNEWSKLDEILEKYKPEQIYIEDVPLKSGSHTLVVLGAVQGMLLALCTSKSIPVSFLLPSDWRGSVGLYDGTRAGTHRVVLKQKAIKMANKKFGLDLLWVSPNSKKNQDDEAEGILIAYSQIKPRYLGKKK